MIEIFKTDLGKALVVLPIIMAANTMLGVMTSELDNSFDKDVLKAGFVKYLTIYGAIALLALAALVATDISVEVGGSHYTLLQAMYVVLWASVLNYAKDAIIKLGKLVLKKNIEERAE